jgi:hypothetical protein
MYIMTDGLMLDDLNIKMKVTRQEIAFLEADTNSPNESISPTDLPSPPNAFINVTDTANTRIKILEDELASKRLRRNNNKILAWFKNVLLYLFLLYAFMIPNLYLVLLYQDNIMVIFQIEQRTPYTGANNKTPTGEQGIQGLQGIQGEAGAQGAQGDEGLQGIQGLQGLQGIQGEQGMQGIQGEQGTQGTQGEQGTQGMQGDECNKEELVNEVLERINLTNLTVEKIITKRLEAETIVGTDYQGTTFNKCVSGWC